MPATKRGVISIVSSIFDPCGFLAPFTFRAKCLIQEVWRTGIQWDDKLKTDLEVKWNAWLKELDELKRFQLPRHHIGFTKAATDIEVHLFADASEKGFGSVAYLKYLPDTGNGTCSFVAAKTRVALIKPQLSIPCLELQATVLAVRLWNCLKEELPVLVKHVYFWTDSMTVIQYINNQTRRFKPFVSNRIAEILDSTNSSQWYHVSSDQNPADYCSRGLPASKLTVKHSWFTGPSFLYSDKESWPVQPANNQDVDGTDPEIKISCFVKTNSGTNQEFPLSSLKIRYLMSPERFSTWQRLLRHTAWLLRALRNFLVPVKRLQLTSLTSSHLLPEEYESALLHWTKQAQEDGFPAEIGCLNKHKDLPAGSTLLPLTPSYDEHHLRLQGRLRKGNVPRDTWNQIILPKSHVITDLLLLDAHLKTFHGGVEHMVAQIRERFWPISVRQTAKKIIRQCFLCKKRRASPKVPRMADLPRQGLTTLAPCIQQLVVEQ
ncbi:uncharacterized protein LOC126823725 isoform X2 [Patella vulgata]|uniref:uncharacterized protein LOC126823725 isoform X2 n=1 Tax=Patella vulgata TaxID=6465 RepID=UPI0024A80659|nr:uncharacterized protein LOC126823725 isoform X2 [Patella vulgata]